MLHGESRANAVADAHRRRHADVMSGSDTITHAVSDTSAASAGGLPATRPALRLPAIDRPAKPVSVPGRWKPLPDCCDQRTDRLSDPAGAANRVPAGGTAIQASVQIQVALRNTGTRLPQGEILI